MAQNSDVDMEILRVQSKKTENISFLMQPLVRNDGDKPKRIRLLLPYRLGEVDKPELFGM